MEHEKDPGWQYLRRTREQVLEVSIYFLFIYFSFICLYCYAHFYRVNRIVLHKYLILTKLSIYF